MNPRLWPVIHKIQRGSCRFGRVGKMGFHQSQVALLLNISKETVPSTPKTLRSRAYDFRPAIKG